jgi:serine/threonine protein kinase
MNSRREDRKESPEFWNRVAQMFHFARSLEPGERGAYLREAKAIDPAIVAEVESLIAEHEQIGSFLDNPAYKVSPEGTNQQTTVVSLPPDDNSQGLIGRVIGHYRIERPIPGGGMGKVYLAHDTRLGGPVALKLLPPEYTKDEELLRRFILEARAARALNHPGILTIYELGEEDGIYFIAAEYVEGTTLRDRISGGPMPVSGAVDVAFQVANALEAVHRLGIIHRDIKPENIMLRPDGIVKVLDFGIAKLTPKRSTDSESTTQLLVETQQDVTPGTPKYMSPDQLRGPDVDARTDIFSLGIVLYEMIAGRPPFNGNTIGEVFASIQRDEPPPLTEYSSEVPPELAPIVTKALQKDREERYQNAGELLIDLKKLKRELEHEPTKSKEAVRVAPQDSVLSFAEIATDVTNEHWSGGRISGNIDKTGSVDYPFERDCSYEFHSSDPIPERDPGFVITVMNNSNKPLLLTAVGVEIVRTAFPSMRMEDLFAVGGPFQSRDGTAITEAIPTAIPRAIHVKKAGAYSIKVPKLLSLPGAQEQLAKRDRSDLSLESSMSVELHHIVSTRLPDPIYIQPEAVFRYELLLEGYCIYAREHVILRMWAQTNCGESRSEEIYIRRSRTPQLRNTGLSDAESRLAQIRRQMLSSSSVWQLRENLFRVEEFLLQHPLHAEARMLKEQIELAMLAESRAPGSTCAESKALPIHRLSSSLYRTSLARLVISIIVGIVVIESIFFTTRSADSEPVSMVSMFIIALVVALIAIILYFLFKLYFRFK